jgi:hypothetical protein
MRAWSGLLPTLNFSRRSRKIIPEPVSHFRTVLSSTSVPLTEVCASYWFQKSRRGPLDHFKLLEDFLIYRESCLVESVIIISEAYRGKL